MVDAVGDGFTFVMWGERGLVASLFADISAAQKPGWQEFLGACTFPESPTGGLPITGAAAMVEPDFGGRGFGQPDAVVRLQLGDGSARVLIVEGKRGLWEKASTVASYRGGEGFNSKLNGQLELNHRLAVALAAHPAGGAELGEPDWVAHSRYNTDAGGRRVLKNAAVLQDVVSRFAGLGFPHYLHLVITADPINPMARDDLQRYMPELYHPDFPYLNAWSELRHRYGWVNWDRLLGVVDKLHTDGRLDHPPYLRSSFALNRRNMGANAPESERVDERPAPDDGAAAAPSPLTQPRSVGGEDTGTSAPDLLAPGRASAGPLPYRQGRGVTLIYAPRINPRTFVHFSWVEQSCRLRDYSRGAPTAENPGPRAWVEQRIQYEVPVARSGHPTSDVEFWSGQIRQLNAEYLQAAR